MGYRYFFTGIFSLFVIVVFAQMRDTTIIINNDSACFLRFPTQRVLFHQEVRPEINCKLTNVIVHVWLLDDWGTCVHDSMQLGEDWQSYINAWPKNSGNFIWKIRVETENTEYGKQIFEYTVPLHITTH